MIVSNASPGRQAPGSDRFLDLSLALKKNLPSLEPADSLVRRLVHRRAAVNARGDPHRSTTGLQSIVTTGGPASVRVRALGSLSHALPRLGSGQTEENDNESSVG